MKSADFWLLGKVEKAIIWRKFVSKNYFFFFEEAHSRAMQGAESAVLPSMHLYRIKHAMDLDQLKSAITK